MGANKSKSNSMSDRDTDKVATSKAPPAANPYLDSSDSSDGALDAVASSLSPSPDSQDEEAKGKANAEEILRKIEALRFKIPVVSEPIKPNFNTVDMPADLFTIIGAAMHPLERVRLMVRIIIHLL